MIYVGKIGQPLVSVIVPTKNSAATIQRCLQSLIVQTYENIEIIVVDNYSTDETRAVAERYGAKVFLKGTERSAQVNFGVGKAVGKYVYRVDSDFVLQPDVIREAVEACEKHGYDAIAIHNTSDPTVSFWARVRKAERDCYRNDELNVAARFWREDVLKVVKGFDEAIIAADDYDIHNRILRAGFRIGRIKSEEVHIGEPQTLAEVFRKHYYYGKNITKFIQKNPDKALLQLGPFRASYFKNISGFFSDPLLIVGFAIYQVVRYAAAVTGLVVTRLEKTWH